jgi:hypothetical protein
MLAAKFNGMKIHDLQRKSNAESILSVYYTCASKGLIVCIWAIEDNIEITGGKKLVCENY